MMMFFVPTCKVASSAQEEQRTNLSTNNQDINTFEQQTHSTHSTQATQNNQHVSVRDVRFDVRGVPGTTPSRA
jgi:hypothetical protein